MPLRVSLHHTRGYHQSGEGEEDSFDDLRYTDCSLYSALSRKCPSLGLYCFWRVCVCLLNVRCNGWDTSKKVLTPTISPHFSPPPSPHFSLASYTSPVAFFLSLLTNIVCRTNMASPMGELFDHLCDSFSLTLCALLIAATMRLGAHGAMFFLVLFFIPFYISHWDNYNTGKLEGAKLCQFDSRTLVIKCD